MASAQKRGYQTQEKGTWPDPPPASTFKSLPPKLCPFPHQRPSKSSLFPSSLSILTLPKPSRCSDDYPERPTQSSVCLPTGSEPRASQTDCPENGLAQRTSFISSCSNADNEQLTFNTWERTPLGRGVSGSEGDVSMSPGSRWLPHRAACTWAWLRVGRGDTGSGCAESFFVKT